ncbi:MAG: hypothetical protein M0R03_06050 [Novosphingobium sp.]|nr:hypothetical protein [Novosphingobium sp.]
MKLAKRVSDLEAKAGHRTTGLDHLTDEELDAVAFKLIQRFADGGVTLPDDWREQYERSPIRFLQWLETQVKEQMACEI